MGSLTPEARPSSLENSALKCERIDKKCKGLLPASRPFAIFIPEVIFKNKTIGYKVCVF
ncbi:MAG: hypothetical protein ACI82S_001689 [Patiriisocius sp.]|jgi:hypothetical protein